MRRTNMTEESVPSPENPAIASCMRAWRHVYQRELAKGESEFMSAHNAGPAYRRAMPPLSGLENIRDFITCVAYGLINEAINDKTGTKLLYAAQVAHTTARGQSAPRKTATE
jgi:hypothetical protein